SANEWPRFELVLLGLGDDGHTASLFPGTAALEESSRWFVANWVEKLQTFRLTLTFPVLNNAVSVLFLVSGSGKSEILRQVLVGPAAQKFPAQRIQPLEGKLLWLIGQDAAAALLHEKTHPPLKLL
ncbi:MAG TPA: 6-phosphogluconolactonase, partial [Candidatus Sulfotelmatobacter sp.]|nr:6-phosphogluconolactonase [Candidatus Sulfotelmatobacter sp.]